MRLTPERVRQLGGVAGLVFVVVAVVSLFLTGSPPKADELSKVTAFLVDKRDEILASDYLAGLAFSSFLLFLGALRSVFGTADRDGVRPGSAALAGGVVGGVMVLVGNGVLNGAAFKVAGADPTLNQALYQVANGIYFMSGFGFAAFFVGSAFAIATTRALPAALLVALLNLVGAAGLIATTGAFAIGGAFSFIPPLASLLWVLAASVSLLRSPPVGAPG